MALAYSPGTVASKSLKTALAKARPAVASCNAARALSARRAIAERGESDFFRVRCGRK